MTSSLFKMRGSSLRMAQKSLLIDVHTHIYTPRLVETLRNRTSNPRIHTSQGNEFLAILPTEHKGGRPIGSQYWSRSERLSFMDRHRIDISLVSLANPWLDFFSPSEAIQAAKEVNEDLEKFCFDPSQVQNQGETGSPASVFSAGDARSNFNSPISNSSRIRAFGSLPFAPGVPVEELVSSLESISKSKLLSGTILGSRGLGKGLDDPQLEPLWEAAERLGQVLFLHPHYGTGQESSNEDGLWGTADNGHVLQLALGFPFETTSAATRLILAGVFDRYPNLKILLAHSGAALPLLSSRLASCVIHDPTVQSRLKHDPRYYLGNFYYDATCYGSEELEFVSKIIGRSQRFKRGGQGLHGTPQIGSEEEKVEKEFGGKRIMFGTDFPFFPPVGKEVEESSQEQPMWMSVTENLNAIRNVRSWGKEDRDRVMFRNAVDLFELKPEYE